MDTWDEEIKYIGDTYKVKYNNSVKTMSCDRNDRGFKVTIHIGGNEKERADSALAVKDFIIHNIL